MGSPLHALLIGGSGFIGRQVARALLAAGHRVTVLSRGRRPLLEGVDSLTADCRDPGALAGALEGRRFDFTVDFQVYRDADVQRLLLVPYAALGRYVMISSGQVYLVAEGARPPFREDDADGAITPEPPAGSRDHDEWSYGVGKRRAEQALLALRATHGVRCVALRLPIVQGEGDTTLRLWSWLERMLDGGPVLLPDGGRQRVRFVYAGDVARAVVWLGENPPPRNARYNLASHDALTLREFLEQVAASAGVRPRFVEVAWSEMHSAGLGESAAPYAGRWVSMLDPSRVAGEWGFAGTRVEDYLPLVVRWHLENRPAQSHAGYALRDRELELAARTGTPAR